MKTDNRPLTDEERERWHDVMTDADVALSLLGVEPLGEWSGEAFESGGMLHTLHRETKCGDVDAMFDIDVNLEGANGVTASAYLTDLDLPDDWQEWDGYLMKPINVDGFAIVGTPNEAGKCACIVYANGEPDEPAEAIRDLLKAIDYVRSPEPQTV